MYSEAISAGVYDEPGPNTGCKDAGADKIENDGGEVIGKPVGPKGDLLSETNVQNALAQSSNTAFTDLEHRATTATTIGPPDHDARSQMASNFGVNINDYPAGSDLSSKLGQVPGVALGEASLTVNEQTQMLATIDDNGEFHSGHVVKSWQLPDQAVQTPSVGRSHARCSPRRRTRRSSTRWRRRPSTVRRSTPRMGLGGRPIIAKTGTTSNYLSGFFIGAIPQYTLVVGMFVNQQDSSVSSADSLQALGGGGFGGYWPANIWNTFAQAEFANLTPESFPSPEFSGQLWNQIGPLPKAKPTKKPTPKCTVMIRGKSFPVPGKGCPTVTPTPTPSNSFPTGFPTSTATPTPSTSITGIPTGTATATPTATPSNTVTPRGGGHGGGTANTANTASGVKAGMAVGGLLAVLLPGSLLWTTSSRRRRRRGAAGSR